VAQALARGNVDLILGNNMVGALWCRLPIGLVALSLLQTVVVANFLGAPGASNSTQAGNMTSAVERPRRNVEETTTITTTTSKPLFPPKPGNDLVGSVDQDDTALTIKVVNEGFESAMEKFKKANARLMKMTCKELDDERRKLDEAYEKVKEQALQASFQAAKQNAIRSREIEHQKSQVSKSVHDIGKDTFEQSEAAIKLQKDYSKATILHMNVLEQYALKCGVKSPSSEDKWCKLGDSVLNDKWGKLQHEVSSIDAIFTEAGWLRNEAVQDMATDATKKAAELRWGEAMRDVGKAWVDTASLGYGLEVQTAACGIIPPAGPWAKPPAKCNLKPSDPMMQALLKDDPAEFVRQWKEMIGKKAGLSPDKVVVDVSGCF